jgi:hypothetical protein
VGAGVGERERGDEEDTTIRAEFSSDAAFFLFLTSDYDNNNINCKMSVF